MSDDTPIIDMTVDEDRRIGLISFRFGAVNALSGANGVPQAISAHLATLEDHEGVDSIGIYAKGKVFSVGADINDFNQNHRANTGPLRDMFAAFDKVNKPIVIAMHGVAFGAGVETALCAHYRIAQVGTQIGLPEVTLGLLPGGGGTQRMPRLVGMPKSVELITSGQAVDATQAMGLGLIDEVFEGAPGDAVAEYAAGLVHANVGLRRTRDRGIAPFDASVFTEAAAALSKGSIRNPGPMRALECLMRADVMSFDDALTAEYADFDKLVDDPLSQGLRHAFLSERLAVKVPGLRPETRPVPLSEVAIVGAGTMGVGIALACIEAGLTTTVIDQSEVAINRAKEIVSTHFTGRIKRGKMTQQAAASQRDLLMHGSDYALIGGADLIIEAVFEDPSVKESVFQQIDSQAKPGAILASNTSTLDLNDIAAFTSRPEAVVGLHFFSPANVMKLLEIVRGSETSDSTLQTAVAFAKRIRKVGVTVGVCDGFVGNRIMEEYLRQCYFLLEEGAMPQDVDHALEDWGWAMGGCKVMDLAGQDIGWAIRKRRAIEQPDRPYSNIPDLLCEMGRFGRKTGKGYYLYPEGTRDILPDPEVEDLIIAHSARIDVPRRTISSDEIVERTLLAMINEGAKILGEGIAARPSDIDAIYLNGYGFGRSRGGPMFQADLIGLETVIERLETYVAGRQGWAFEPAEFLYEMRSRGLSFADLDRGMTLERAA